MVILIVNKPYQVELRMKKAEGLQWTALDKRGWRQIIVAQFIVASYIIPFLYQVHLLKLTIRIFKDGIQYLKKMKKNSQTK